MVTTGGGEMWDSPRLLDANEQRAVALTVALEHSRASCRAFGSGIPDLTSVFSPGESH